MATSNAGENGTPWDRTAGKAAVAALCLVLASASGCSSVTEPIVNSYRSTVDFLTGGGKEDEAEDKAKAKDKKAADKPAAPASAPAPAEKKADPEVVKVPEKPQPAPRETRERSSKGLAGDQQRRRYSGDAIARQGADDRPLAAAAPPAATPPAASVAETPKPVAASPFQPPQAAAAPPPLPAPTSVSETFVARLREGVPQGSAGGPPAMAGSSPFGSSMADDPFATVVVSSDGIEFNGGGGGGGGSPFGGGRPMKTLPPSLDASMPAFGGEEAPMMSGSLPPAGSVKVATIQFDDGAVDLDSKDLGILRQVVALQRERGGRIQVVGHSSSRTRAMDPVKHSMINFEKSAQRADSVARRLMDLGVAANQISVTALSDASPMYYEVMPTGEAGNRRAEIYLVN